MCPRPPLRCALFLLGTLLFWVSAGKVQAAPPLPPPPPGMIQDTAHVLLPEAAKVLSQRLQTAAEERGIWVYVVTLPSLGVPPSKQRERLVNMGDLYRHGWLGNRVGVVLLVDDESGAGMIAASEATNRLYPPLQRNLLMEEPLRLLQKEPLRRDKIEKTALMVVAVISHLQDESKKSKRRDLWVNVAMVVVSIAGVGLIVWVKWVRERKTGSPADVPRQTGD